MDRSGFTDLHMMAMDGTNAPCVSLSLSLSLLCARSLVRVPTLRGIEETVCARARVYSEVMAHVNAKGYPTLVMFHGSVDEFELYEGEKVPRDAEVYAVSYRLPFLQPAVSRHSTTPSSPT